MNPPATTHSLSPECTLAAHPDYENLHANCNQTTDIPLPHAFGILLQARCGCTCHSPRKEQSS